MVQLKSATSLRLALNAVLPVVLVVCAVWAWARGAGPGELFVISPGAADRVEHLGQAVVEKVICVAPFKVHEGATQTTLQFVNDLHLHMYIYYTCVCVCVCVCACVYSHVCGEAYMRISIHPGAGVVGSEAAGEDKKKVKSKKLRRKEQR